MKRKITTANLAALRNKAEELLKKKLPTTGSQLSEADMLKLVQELEVYQIELELQQEELMWAEEQSAIVATEKYAKLYDFAPTGYFTISREGEIITLNLSGSQMLGKERSYLIKSRFSFFISDDTKPIFRLFLDQVFAGKERKTCEVTLLTDGDLPIYVYLTGIATENGKQCLLVAVDITERKMVEQDLNKAKEKAEESDRLKSILLANISHEIRTPMNGILGFASLLKEPDLTKEEQQEYIRIIEKSGAHVLEIFNDIISFSKVESGQLEVLISETNIIKNNASTEGSGNLFNPDVSGLKILVAEDDETSEVLIQRLIKMFGKEVLNVRTGIEAVEACRNNPDIDLVLMDIKMPEMDGYEATRQIRQFNNEVVIIVQTAYALTGDQEKATAAGCNDYITKPINQAILNELVKKHFYIDN